MKSTGEITLAEIINKKLKLENEEIMGIFRDLLSQAAAAYQNGYIMYDIKPDNIVYDWKKKKATIVDHGFSKPINYKGIKACEPAYRAPHGFLNDNIWMVHQTGRGCWN